MRGRRAVCNGPAHPTMNARSPLHPRMPIMQAMPTQTPTAYAPSITRTLLMLWGLFWLLMMIVAVQDYSRGNERDFWQPLLWEGSSALVASCWLWLQRRIDRRYAIHLDQPARWFAHHLKWLPIVALTFIPTIYGIRYAVYAALGTPYQHDTWPFLIVYESIKLLLFAGLWLGIIFGLSTFAQWQAQREGMLQLQKSLADAQLARLRSQLQPHFLFNALNTISALMHSDVERADRLLTRLSDLLRSSLQNEALQWHTITDEVKLLELYADIMQERFGERVTVKWRIDDAARGAVVPVMVLQPLLENAFKHGVEPSIERTTVTVEAKRNDTRMLLAVTNEAHHAVAQPGMGVGLLNTRERLKVMYGGDALVQLTRTDDRVTAAVDVPYRTL